MNCPKCGFAQEERADCRKCGVVFSKYFSLHGSGESMTESDARPAGAGHQDPASAEIAELRRGLRDLTRRFTEVEFERAERNKMRAELKLLQDKFEESASKILPAVDKAADLEQTLHEISNELADSRSKQEIFSTLADRISTLEERVLQLPVSASARAADDARAAIKEEVSELRDSLSLSHSATGELKNNYLELCSRFQSLQQQLETRAQAAPTSSGSLTQLDGEVQALRAEVHELLRNIELLNARTSNSLQTIPGLQAQIQQLQAAFTQAMTIVEESAASLHSGMEALELQKDPAAPVSL